MQLIAGEVHVQKVAQTSEMINRYSTMIHKSLTDEKPPSQIRREINVFRDNVRALAKIEEALNEFESAIASAVSKAVAMPPRKRVRLISLNQSVR
jgi:hypothetical protein